MKKILALVLVMMLCAVSALATSVPSIEIGDMMRFRMRLMNGLELDDPTLGLDDPFILGLISMEIFDVIPTAEELREIYEQFINFGAPTDEERMSIVQIELDKLAQFENVEDYFGNVIDRYNLPVVLREMMKWTDADVQLAIDAGEMEPDTTIKLNVFEFMPVIAGGWKPGFGDVEVDMQFLTPYEPGTDVAVMIGIVDIQIDETTGEKTQTVQWTALEGEVNDIITIDDIEYGSVTAIFDEETVLEIQDNIALLAIVSPEEVPALTAE